MYFQSEFLRLAHPQAKLIPSSTWDSYFEKKDSIGNNQLDDNFIRLMQAPLEEVLSSAPVYESDNNDKKIQYWICVASSHPEMNADQLMALTNLPSNEIFTLAAACGRLDVLKKMRFSQQTDDTINRAFCNAARNGQIDVLEHFKFKRPTQIVSLIKKDRYDIFVDSVIRKQLNTLKWFKLQLLPYQLEGAISVLNRDSDFKHFFNSQILEWLSQQMPADKFETDIIKNFCHPVNTCDPNTIDIASIQWIKENYPQYMEDILTASDFVNIRDDGRTDYLSLLQKLQADMPELYAEFIEQEDSIIKEAIEFGRLDVLQWYESTIISPDTFDETIINPQHLLDQLVASLPTAILKAQLSGHVGVLQWCLHTIQKQENEENGADNATLAEPQITANAVNIWQWIFNHIPHHFVSIINDDEAFEAAFIQDPFALINFIKQDAPCGHTLATSAARLIDFAIKNQRIDVLNRLQAELPAEMIETVIEASNGKYLCDAVATGNVSLLNWFEQAARASFLDLLQAKNHLALRIAIEVSPVAAAWIKAAYGPTRIHIYHQVLLGIINAPIPKTALKNKRLWSYHIQAILTWLTDTEGADYVENLLAGNALNILQHAAKRGDFYLIIWIANKIPPARFASMIRECKFDIFSYGDSLFFCQELKAAYPELLQHVLHSSLLNDPDRIEAKLLKWLKTEEPAIYQLASPLGIESFPDEMVDGEEYDEAKALLTEADVFDHAEALFAQSDFYPLLKEAAEDYLETIKHNRDELAEKDANAIFDLADNDMALYGYYVLRFLIRHLDNPNAIFNSEAIINELLLIPAIKALVILNATETDLPDEYNLANRQFASRSNELLRICIRTNNPNISRCLLAIPELLEEAERNNFYATATSINLRALAANNESSMTALTPEEKDNLAKLMAHYKPVLSARGVKAIIDELREELKARFLAPENSAARTVTLRGEAHILPVDFQAFRQLITDLQLTAEEINQANIIYFKNLHHNVLRYLSKPNYWINTASAIIRRDRTRRLGWATFEEYLPLIALLKTAASDESEPPTVSNVTVADRVALLFREIMSINRAHNWDHKRPALDKNGQPKIDSTGTVVLEEFDDLTLDKPSCYPGVNSRLLQSLLYHPQYRAFNHETLRRFIRETIHEHYANYLPTLSLQDLRALKTAVYAVLVDGEDFEGDIWRLLLLPLDTIMPAVIREFGAGASRYALTVNDFLHPNDKPYPFLTHYAAAGLGDLLDRIIRDKEATQSPRQNSIFEANKRKRSSDDDDVDDKILKRPNVSQQP